MARRVLPASYYYFFLLVEPGLTLIGAYVAMFRPEQYASDLLPLEYEPVTRIMGQTSRGQIVVGGLGSCFLLLAMISLSLFPIIRNSLASNPAAAQKVANGLLVPLAIADLIHIFMTLLPLPMSLLTSPLKWTLTYHCNITITITLFLVRMAYFLGIGRSEKMPVRRKSHGQANMPLPAARGTDAGSGTARAIAEVEKSPAKKRR